MKTTKSTTFRRFAKAKPTETRQIMDHGDPVTIRLTRTIEAKRQKLSLWHPLNAPFPSD